MSEHLPIVGPEGPGLFADNLRSMAGKVERLGELTLTPDSARAAVMGIGLASGVLRAKTLGHANPPGETESGQALFQAGVDLAAPVAESYGADKLMKGQFDQVDGAKIQVSTDVLPFIASGLRSAADAIPNVREGLLRLADTITTDSNQSMDVKDAGTMIIGAGIFSSVFIALPYAGPAAAESAGSLDPRYGLASFLPLIVSLAMDRRFAHDIKNNGSKTIKTSTLVGPAIANGLRKLSSIMQ
jgi:hypothetical protein